MSESDGSAGDKTDIADVASVAGGAPPDQARRPSRAEVPTTEEEIQAAYVVPQPPHNGTIYLAEYDLEWPRLFEREAERIRAALGERALLVEHAGSTSVPGLAAKPVIDIVLVVPDSADEPAYVPAMEAAGYILRAREPGWYEHRFFKGPDTNINLHVFSRAGTRFTWEDWLETK